MQAPVTARHAPTTQGFAASDHLTLPPPGPDVAVAGHDELPLLAPGRVVRINGHPAAFRSLVPPDGRGDCFLQVSTERLNSHLQTLAGCTATRDNATGHFVYLVPADAGQVFITPPAWPLGRR